MSSEVPEEIVLAALEDRVGITDATIIDCEAFRVDSGGANRVYDLLVEVDAADWHGELFLPSAAVRPPALFEEDEEPDGQQLVPDGQVDGMGDDGDESAEPPISDWGATD